MWEPLISCPALNSISKPSIRKHSSSENLFADHHHHLHLQSQNKYTFAFSPVPPSPSRKAHPTIYTCICFICFFVIVTVAAILHCSNIDPPRIVEHASFSTNPSACCDAKGQQPVHIIKPTPALKGLGTVFTRGTKAMSELVVAHITENTELEDLRLFLRTLYRSGVIARADTVFLFTSSAFPVSMVDVIYEENRNFHKLLRVLSSDEHSHNVANSSFSTMSSSSSTFLSPSMMHVFSNASISPLSNAYKKASTENEANNTQTFWGCAYFSGDNRSEDEAQLGWGSVVGFGASELNPDDTLQGFFDHPPLILRRWACYQMLLGMVRHRFKHVLLTDVSGVAILGDPFVLVRRKQGLYLSLEDRAWGASNAVELGVNLSLLNADSENDLPRRGASHNRVTLSSSKSVTKRQLGAQLDVHQKGRRRARKSTAAGGLYERVYGKRMWSSLEEFERRKKLVNSGAIVGGIHQIRGLANTMVTEIVKVALERANREAFPDNVLLSYLLHKSSSVLGKRVLEHLHLLDNGESFVHSLIGSQQPSLFLKRTRAPYPMIQGNCKSKRWGKAAQAIHEDICSSPADAMVYMDCIHTQAPRKVSFNPLLNFI